MSDKPADVALRVPIDRDQMMQKVKAKMIYNEEKMSLVKENKEKLHQEEQKKAEEKLKLMEKKVFHWVTSLGKAERRAAQTE
jgi:hypothetical protein